VNNTYLFISDIHLGLQSKETEKAKELKLVSFLNYARENCSELFIAGDLFDYWFEYKRVYQKGFFRTLTALQDLTQAGVKVHYFIGNHDFLHRNFFTDEIGVELHEDGIDKTLNGKRFFIAHGDGLVKNDWGYNILKAILRNKFIQKLYSLIHPDLGVYLASHTSKTSREYTSQKNYGDIDGLFEAAKKKIDSGFDYVLFGHLHKRVYEKYKSGLYVNLGSWLSKPCYGIFKDNKFEIVDLK
jgi:UDP-2,3-diacylglucosamine hydrolase